MLVVSRPALGWHLVAGSTVGLVCDDQSCELLQLSREKTEESSMVRKLSDQALKRASKIAQWHKGIPCQVWHLSLVSGTHLVEEENHSPQDVL